LIILKGMRNMKETQLVGNRFARHNNYTV